MTLSATTPLHIVSKSPFAHSALAECLRVCGEKAAIILIEDAVNAALINNEWALQLKNSKCDVFVLQADLDARGLTSHIEPLFKCIDYSDFVQLCCDHTPIVSWY